MVSGNSLLICGKDKVRNVAIDTGEVRWEIPGAGVCIKEDRAYLARRDGTRIACVDLNRGTVIWESRTDDVVRATQGKMSLDRRGEIEKKKYTVRLQAGAGVLLVSTEDGKSNTTYALSTESGDPLWSNKFGGKGFSRRLGPFFIDDAVWSLDPGNGVLAVRRPENGELLREIPAPGIRYAGHHPRCYQARATSRYIIGKERGPDWFHRSFFQNFPGRRLYCTTGLLDGEWHRRMYSSYGQIVGQYIAFRGSMGYAVQVFATSPREGGLNSGQGYVVYAGRTAEKERSQKLFALRPDQSQWRVRLSIRPVAMILAGDRLLLAGPPDFEDPTENLAAIEGRRKAELLVLRTDDGVTEATYPLDSPPIYDGIASVAGRLYVCTMEGRVACLAGRNVSP